eukprot:2703682-Rhodomonas_salina.4
METTRAVGPLGPQTRKGDRSGTDGLANVRACMHVRRIDPRAATSPMMVGVTVSLEPLQIRVAMRLPSFDLGFCQRGLTWSSCIGGRRLAGEATSCPRAGVGLNQTSSTWRSGAAQPYVRTGRRIAKA